MIDLAPTCHDRRLSRAGSPLSRAEKRARGRSGLGAFLGVFRTREWNRSRYDLERFERTIASLGKGAFNG
jgi:hypothetical protein